MSDPFPRVSVSRMLGRGLTRRCARCGGGHLFKHWVSMVEDCPRCGHRFEREDGYWLGSITINTAAMLLGFAIAFVTTAALTWPDPNWTLVLVVGIAANLIVPVAFHPISRTLWVAAEVAANPISEEEERAAQDRVAERLLGNVP